MFDWHVTSLHCQHGLGLHRIGLHTDKSRLNYSQFLAAFEDGRKSSYGRRPGEVRIEEYSNLSPEQAEEKLRLKLEKNIDDVTRVRRLHQAGFMASQETLLE